MLTRRSCFAGFWAGASSVRIDGPSLHAHPADRFVDSVGVCTHLESEPYSQNFDGVLRRGAALGVRHIRDEIRPGNDMPRWRRLFAEGGIRSHLLASPATNTQAELMDFVLALGPDAVSAVEGQNEGDGPWFKAHPAAQADWAKTVIDYQRALFQALRERTQTAGIPIVSPTVLDYQPDDMRLLQASAPFCDIVALHAYLQGQQEPETEQDFAGIAWYRRSISDPFKPQAPVMVTETGYATTAKGISDRAAGIYLPRLLLHLFDSGIVRTFLYELMDESNVHDDPEHNYGLLTPSASPKPAFGALRLLLGALADPGPAYRAAPVTLSVEDGPPDLRLIPFRKRDGVIVLAIWRAVRVWDPAELRDLVVQPAPVRLLLPPRSTAATMVLAEGGAWTPVTVPRHGLELELRGTAMLVTYAGAG